MTTLRKYKHNKFFFMIIVTSLFCGTIQQSIAQKDTGQSDNQEKSLGEKTPEKSPENETLEIDFKEKWQSWIRIPNIEGTTSTGESEILKHQAGRVQVVFFIASWCIPCQNFMEKIKSLENHYAPKGVDFEYVFNHDLKSDMRGFIDAHNLSNSSTILSTGETLLKFRDPTLPALFIADKKGWIVERMLGTKETPLDAQKIKKALDFLTLK